MAKWGHDDLRSRDREPSVKLFPKEVSYKFNEDKIIEELRNYIEETYSGPYVGKNNIQAFDLIRSCGHGMGFAMGNAIKYAARYGKKEGHNRKDIMKALHYLIMALFCHDDEKEAKSC